MGKSMVSCKFSLQTIHGSSHRTPKTRPLKQLVTGVPSHLLQWQASPSSELMGLAMISMKLTVGHGKTIGKPWESGG